MKRNFYATTLLLIISTLFIKVYAQPPHISYELVSGVPGFTFPIYIANAHDGSNRLFIVERAGKIKVLNGTTVTDFMDISSMVLSDMGERGLLCILFEPGYDGINKRNFYVYYTGLNTDIVLDRFQTPVGNKNIGDPATRLPILRIEHPLGPFHHGGTILFGPNDGYLYIGTGDGGGDYKTNNNAQSGNSLLGKILRIIPDPVNGSYSIPADNPYVGNPAIKGEIWAFGLRNPYRWSFDRANGNMWIADVGEHAREEVNYQAANHSGPLNYGWTCYEGFIQTPGITLPCNPPDYIPPVFDYDHYGGQGNSITGGFVYRGPDYPNFRGYYIASDWSTGEIFLWPNGSGSPGPARQVTDTLAKIVSFGEAEDGTLYMVSNLHPNLYKVIATNGTPLPVTLSSFSAKHFPSYNELKWTTSFEQGTSHFDIEVSNNGQSFQNVGTVAATRNTNGSYYNFQHRVITTVPLYYRLAIKDDDGSVKYSSVLKVEGNNNGQIQIYPTVIQNGILNLFLPKPVEKLQLVNSVGKVVFEKSLKGIEGSTAIDLPLLSKGVYFAQIIGNEGKTTKLVIE